MHQAEPGEFSSKRSPWVTHELKHLMFNGDYLKKRAISSKDPKNGVNIDIQEIRQQ